MKLGHLMTQNWGKFMSLIWYLTRQLQVHVYKKKNAAVVRPVTLKGKIILKSQEKYCDGINNIWDIPKVSNDVSIQDLQAVML